MKIDLENPEKHKIEKIAEVIRTGGTILYPTDTVYGLGCDPFNPAALERILAIKGRDLQKGMLVLVPSETWLSRVADLSRPSALDLCRNWWPGPVTCLFQAVPELPGLLTGRQGKIGVRMPANRFLTELMNCIPGALVSTSANLSGEAASCVFSGINPAIVAGVDLVIEALNCAPAGGRASSVVDLTGDTPLLVREGEGIETIRSLGIGK